MPIMSIKTKIALLIIVIITAVATIFAANYHPKSYENIIRPIVKVDMYLPLSGANSSVGLAAQQTVQNILNKTNQQTSYKYDISYKDAEKENPQQSDNIFISMENNPDTQVSVNIANDKISIRTRIEDIISQIAKELKQKNIKKVAYITLAQGEYQNYANMLNQALQPEIQMVGAVYQKKQENFSPIINMLINNDAEYFIIMGSAAETDKIIKLLQARGIANYKIATIFAANMTGKINLYNDTILIAPKSDPFNSKMFATAVLSVINAYEQNYQPQNIPPAQQIFDYINKEKASDKNIFIETQTYQIKDNKISPKEASTKDD